MELIDHSYKFKPKRIEDKYMDTPQYIANSLDYDIDKLLMPKLSDMSSQKKFFKCYFLLAKVCESSSRMNIRFGDY